MPATFAELQQDVDELVGADLDPTVRDRYLNEGYVELCVRSHWSKATFEIGPAAEATRTYAFHADMRLPQEVWVDNLPYEQIDQGTYRDIANGDKIYTGYGVWWVNTDSDYGTRRVGILPSPTGATIRVLSVAVPPLMEADDDEPTVPSDFRQAIVDYVAGYALGRQEDLTEDRLFHQQEFERQVDRLFRLGVEQTAGSSVAQAKLKGLHFA